MGGYILKMHHSCVTSQGKSPECGTCKEAFSKTSYHVQKIDLLLPLDGGKGGLIDKNVYDYSYCLHHKTYKNHYYVFLLETIFNLSKNVFVIIGWLWMAFMWEGPILGVHVRGESVVGGPVLGGGNWNGNGNGVIMNGEDSININGDSGGGNGVNNGINNVAVPVESDEVYHGSDYNYGTTSNLEQRTTAQGGTKDTIPAEAEK